MNEKSKKRIDEILHALSDATGIAIEYRPLEEDQGRVVPIYDVNAILSKIVALMVFSGHPFPATFAPSYNRVHADIEWWKQEMAQLEAEPEKTASADAPAQT